jgi:hypothetical protein
MTRLTPWRIRVFRYQHVPYDDRRRLALYEFFRRGRARSLVAWGTVDAMQLGGDACTSTLDGSRIKALPFLRYLLDQSSRCLGWFNYCNLAVDVVVPSRPRELHRPLGVRQSGSQWHLRRRLGLFPGSKHTASFAEICALIFIHETSR